MNPEAMTTPVPRPFVLKIPDSELADLQEHLRTRWIYELSHTDWNSGAPVSTLQDLCASRRDGFDWREQESRLNTIPPILTSHG